MIATQTFNFNFDSKENTIIQTKTPGAKAINKPSGIWVAFDNQELAQWEEGKWVEGGVPHEVETREVINDAGDFKKIPGTLYREPRLLVLQRSPLLKELKGGSSRDRQLVGVWQKGDKDKGFSPVMFYLLMFLDKDNQLLHERPVQLAARGSFQLNFNWNLIGGDKIVGFQEACEIAYTEATQAKRVEKKHPRWHAMWVYCPKFRTEMRGVEPNVSPACITYGYEVPTAENWDSLCIGRTPLAARIAKLYDETIDFWKAKLPENTTASQSPAVDSDEDFGISPREDLYQRIEAAMSETGWTVEEARKYLEKTYGVRSRSKLSEEQLLEFLQSIEAVDF